MELSIEKRIKNVFLPINSTKILSTIGNISCNQVNDGSYGLWNMYTYINSTNSVTIVFDEVTGKNNLPNGGDMFFAICI